MDDSMEESPHTITNIIAYGSPAAKSELIVKFIMRLDSPEFLQKLFKSIGEQEFKRVVGQA